MSSPIHFTGENQSNDVRTQVTQTEPLAMRTYTPTQAVIAKSAGVFHWTLEGRRLYDFSSGVLVANLGHNPSRWMKRFGEYMGWTPETFGTSVDDSEFVEAAPMTAYNAVTPVEVQANSRLLASVRATPHGSRLNQLMWAASGSEAVQKALWACLHRDPKRDIILASRYGFHGKKGLAGAVTGSENSPDRDPRVKFFGFPMEEIADGYFRNRDIDLVPYQDELHRLQKEFGSRLNVMITEPYLGGGGSYHPPASYLQMLVNFCQAHDIMFILDEVQANFGRTGSMYAFEAYGIEPDFVTLGKGMGNGVPVAAVAGRSDVMSSLSYGEASDTWSANPLASASVLATLDEFEGTDVMDRTRHLSGIFRTGLERLKETGLITKVRGEGLVFGIEAKGQGDLSAKDVANALVEAAYLGEEGGDGIHLLGALAGTVLRVSPPMCMTDQQAKESLELLYGICERTAIRLRETAVGAGARS